MKKLFKYSCICLSATILLGSCNGSNAEQNNKQDSTASDTVGLDDGYIAMFRLGG